MSRHNFPLLHSEPLLPVFDGKHVPNVTWEKCASKLARTLRGKSLAICINVPDTNTLLVVSRVNMVDSRPIPNLTSLVRAVIIQTVLVERMNPEPWC